MIRTRSLVLSLALAGAGTIGCTFCDTCDDFPTPMIGGAGYAPVGGPPMVEGSFTPPAAAVPGEAAVPPAGTASPFAASAPADTGDTMPPQIPKPEADMEKLPNSSPPAPDAPKPESDVPVQGTAPEGLPGTNLPTTPTLPDPAIPAAPAPPTAVPTAPTPAQAPSPAPAPAP